MNNCPVCDLNRLKSIGTDVYKCDNCKHTYVDFKGDGLQYHKDEYRKNDNGTRTTDEISNGKFTEKFHNFRNDICKNRIIAIEELFKHCDTLLDIGAGGGTFVTMIKDKFSLIECQEISEICINNLNEYGFKVYEGDFNNINFEKRYDLVTCWHSLEHMKDLKGFVKNVKETTEKFLVIEIPIDRGIPNPNTDWDGHYHYFSKDSLKLLFKEHFDIIDIIDGVQSPSLLILLKNKDYEF